MDSQEIITNFIPKSVNWHIYNLAKTQEKRLFYKLLDELGSIIPEPMHINGRPPVSVRDLFFSLGLKVYSNYSGRKVSSDLHHAEQACFIKKAAHFNTLNDFLNCPATHDLLQKLLMISALPLKHLEDQFSVDSSGFGAYQYERWTRVRFSKEENAKRRNYLKGHISVGTRTHVICAAEITEGFASDVKQAPELVKRTLANFSAKEFSMDKAYSSKRMLQLIESLGAMPMIPFRKGTHPNDKSPKIWTRMFNYFEKHQIEFMRKYHRRSNIETVFSMIKMRLGEFLKCKNFESQRNELLMKFICHNICCLIQEIFENEVHIDFKKCLERYIDPKDVKMTEQEVEMIEERYSSSPKIEFLL